MNDHPGGGESITGVAGQDASEDFMAIHSTASRKQLAEYVTPFILFSSTLSLPYFHSSFHVGTLVKGGKGGPLSKPLPPLPTSGDFLHKTQWKKVTLTSIKTASHDSVYYRFTLESPDQPLGLVRFLFSIFSHF